jgi:hypothetical protein
MAFLRFEIGLCGAVYASNPRLQLGCLFNAASIFDCKKGFRVARVVPLLVAQIRRNAR